MKQVFLPWWELKVPYLDKGRREVQDTSELDKLWDSMKEGQEAPVIMWTDGTIFSGVRRYLAAKRANGKVRVTTPTNLFVLLDKMAAECEIQKQYQDVSKRLLFTEAFWLMRAAHDWDDTQGGPNLRRSIAQLGRAKAGEAKKAKGAYNDIYQRWAAALGWPQWHTANTWQCGNRAFDFTRTEEERAAAWKVLTDGNVTGQLTISREARVRAEVRQKARESQMSPKEVEALLANLGAVTTVLNGMDPNSQFSPLQRQRLLEQFGATRTRLLYLTKYLREGVTA